MTRQTCFARLFELIQQRAIVTGDFVLSGGGRSRYLFKLRRVTMLGEGADLIGRILTSEMVDLGIGCVGGMERGAVPIVQACGILAHQQGMNIDPFFILKEPKAHGHGEEIEGYLSRYRPILLVDDVATTGASILQARNRILPYRDADADPIAHAFVIVDRLEGAVEALAKEGIILHALFTKDDFDLPA